MGLSYSIVDRARGLRLTKQRLANLVIIIIGVAALVSLGRYKPVHAAACTASTATVTKTSSPIFYVDTPTYLDAYTSYRVDTGASGSFTDLWVKVDTFTNTSLLGLAPTEDGLYHVGALSTSSSANVYFYFKGAVTASAQSYTLHLYNGKPSSGGIETCTSSQSNTSVASTIESGNNTVNSVSYTAPYLGGDFTMTIMGTTGTIGSAGLFSYTPATQNGWSADCLELKGTSLIMTGGNTGSFSNGLYQSGLSSGTTNYTLIYTFNTKCVTSTSTDVVPLTYISSGAQVKHTSVSNYGSLPPIAPATNALVMTKSASPSFSASGGTVTYHVNVTNNGPNSATLDDFTDVLPSSPATASYISGTSTFDNDTGDGTPASAISNPSSSGQTLTWVRSFTIASGKTAQLSYDVTIPSTAGSYINSAVAHTGSTQIDQTADTSDNVPATAIYGVGSLSLAGSTKTGADINGGSLQPGDTIQYTIDAVASGTQDATGVHIVDTIDTNTQNVSGVVVGASATNCGSSYSNISTSTKLEITGISITHGTTCQITFQVTVKSSAADGTTILNSATITAAEAGSISGNPSSTPMIVHKDPILSVTNVENDADNVVIANQVITYTTTITNTGQATGNGIDLVGTITGPVGSLSSRTLTNCGSVYVDTSSSLTINIAGLAVTTTNPCVISYTYTVNGGASSGTVTNSVDITAAREGGNDPAAVSASNLLIGAAPTAPNLSVAVTEDDVDNQVSPGQSITYSIAITNSGQTDATTSLTSAIPSELGTPGTRSYINCGSPSSSFSAPTLSVTSISIPAANTCTISFSISVDTPLDEGTSIIVGADVAAASQGGNNPANANATTLTVDATPILDITYAENDADNVVTPSQDITYTLTINNTGNGSATIVGAIDNLVGPAGSPSNFNFSNCGSSYTNNSSTGFNTVDLTIAVGTPCVVTYHNAVNNDASQGQTIANTIDVSGAAEGGDNPIPVAATTLTVSALPDLAVTSAENDADNVVSPGQDVTYTTTITNNGNTNATAVGLIDTFTGSLDSIGSFSFTGCGSSYSNSSSGSTVTVAGLQISSGGGSCVVVYHATIAAAAAGASTVVNSADVSAAGQGGNNPDAVSASTLTVVTTPNLNVSVGDNDADNTVTPGQTIGFTVTVSNNGNSTGTTSAAVTIPSAVGSPSSIQFSNCGSPGSSYSNPTLSLTSLSVGTSTACVITFNVAVNSPGTAGATFVVAADVAAASQGGNNPASVDSSTMTIDTTPVLSTSTYVISDVNGGTLVPGDAVTYTLTIVNSGDGSASGLTVDSAVSAYTTINPASVSYSHCGSSVTDNTDTANLTFSGLSVAIGTNCVISVSGSLISPVNEGMSINASATIGAANEGGSGYAASSNTLTIDATPSLTVTSTENDADNQVDTGQDITYTVTITNSGNGQATGVSLSDPVSGFVGDVNTIGYSNCGSSHSDGSTGSTLSLSDLSIAVGTPCVVTFHVSVDNAAPGASTIIDGADASAAAEGGNNPAATSATTLTVKTVPVLSVSTEENDVDNIVTPGQVVTYTVTINNSGNGTAHTSGTITIPSATGSPANVAFSHCGTPGSSYSSPTLSLSSLRITNTDDCVITFTSTVANPNTESATFTVDSDIAAATEGGNNPANEPSSMLTVNTTPNLSTSTITQTDSNGGTLKPGDTVNYQITIINTGDGTANGVSLNNVINSNLSFSPSGIDLVNCGVLTTDNSTSAGLDIVGLQIDPGTNCVISYSAVVNSPLNEGTSISGSATISPASEGGPGASPQTSTLTVDATPNLSTSTLAASDLNGGTLKPGETVGYTLTIKNTGDGDASGVSIADLIASNSSLDTGSLQFTNCGGVYTDGSSSSSLSVSGLSIAVGTDCVIYFEVTVNTPLNQGTSINTSVTIGAASQGGLGASKTSNTLTVDATPHLNVSIGDDDEDNVVNLGQTVNTQIIITNNGDGDATRVGMSYTLTAPGESITGINFDGCGGAVNHSLSGMLLVVDSLNVVVGHNCVITLAFNVANSASDGAAIGQSASVGAAYEGGNTPAEVTATNLIVDISNAAPNIPADVTSSILIGNHVYGAAGLSGAQLSSTLTDPNASDQVRYRIQIGTNSSFSTDVAIDYRSDYGAQGGSNFTYQQTGGTYLIGSSSTELSDGIYYVRIRNEDSNNASSAWYVVPGVAFRYDTTPPAKPDAPFVIGEPGVGTATIGWDVTGDSDPDARLPYRLEYSTDPEFGTFTDVDSANLSAIIASLDPNTHYYFRIYWRDAAGNMSEPSDALDVYIPAETTPGPDPEEPGAPESDNTSNLPFGGPASVVVGSGRSSLVIDDGEGETTTVIIMVKDTNGRPLKGAKVTLHSKPRVGYTDKDGVVIFYGVPVGKHGVIVEYAGRFTESTLITLKKGVQELKVDLTLNKPEVYRSWWWLWLLLLIPLWMYYRHRRKQELREKDSKK